MAAFAVEHRRRLMRAYWRSLRCIETWMQGNRQPWIAEVERLRGMINENRGLPVAEGKKLVRKFEDRLEEVWLIDNYKVPHMPGQGTLYMRNPPAPTHRVKYILNYARPGFDPVIGPSYTGPLKPGEVQYRPPMADYNDLSEDADAYISSGEHKERHMEKTPVPSPSQ